MPLDDTHRSHRHNLIEKIRRAERDPSLAPMLPLARRCLDEFDQIIRMLQETVSNNRPLDPPVTAVSEYVEKLKKLESERTTKVFFNHRSNFAGSVIPEFLYVYISTLMDILGYTAYFSTKDSVVELQFTGLSSKPVIVRHKDQDFCMGLSKQKLPDSTIDFVVPLIAIEVKTNIDINKLNGLDFSAQCLKRSFPSSKYYLVTETIDFSLSDNFSTLQIDEIFVLRKMTRSQFRRTRSGVYCSDVFEQIANEIISEIEKINSPQTHVYDRLPAGRLIHA